MTAIANAPAPSALRGISGGVASLLDNFASIKPADQVVIAYAADSRKYAAHLILELQSRDIGVRAVAMRPLVDPDIKAELHAVLPPRESLSGKLVVITLEKDSMSHFEVFAELFELYGKNKCKILRIISAADELFASAFTRTPRELSLRNATLLEKLRSETKIRVTTEAGTDVEIELDHDRYDWISNRGTWRPGAFMILPAGEIATYPAKVNGILIADGALNCNIVTRMDMRLGSQPLRITIEDSVAVDFACTNSEINYLVEGCFSRENGRFVGELGFGTNDGIADFVSDNSHMNERYPGLHLGFGQHNQAPSNVRYYADIHLDVVTRGGSVHLPDSGEVLRLDGFNPRHGIAHPVLIRDQDITGDCCSSGCSVVRPVFG
ncbi:MAG TPA: hypothetical protein VGX49_17250 [Jatrophihabitans sp.]|jgi:hypothetical protein|nr:hypothetical protein [Jatrophihabitans sp.]